MGFLNTQQYKNAPYHSSSCMQLQGENFLPLLCKLGFREYPLRFTFIDTSIHDALKSCWFVLFYCCYVTGLIGVLVIGKMMLPIFNLADIETELVTRARRSRVLFKLSMQNRKRFAWEVVLRLSIKNKTS